MRLIHILNLLVMFAASNEAYNILVVAPFPVIGHWLWMESFTINLLDRGHKVTVIASFMSRHVNANYSEIIVPILKMQNYCKF